MAYDPLDYWRRIGVHPPAASSSGPPTPKLPNTAANTGTPAAAAPAAATAPAKTPEELAAEKDAKIRAAADARLADDTAFGTAYAKDALKDGSLGRMVDPRAADMQSLLDRQKAGLDGLSAEENRAMREQGIAGINQQTNQNLRRMANIAGSAGASGGSAAGLQMQALNQGGAARAGFERQMVIDNIAQKNLAMDRYGNSLTGQQGTELGINQYNIGQSNKETLGRLDLAEGKAGQRDSYYTSGVAAGQTQDGLDLAKGYLKDLGSANDAAKTSASATTDKAKAVLADPSATGPQKDAARRIINDAEAGRDSTSGDTSLLSTYTSKTASSTTAPASSSAPAAASAPAASTPAWSPLDEIKRYGYTGPTTSGQPAAASAPINLGAAAASSAQAERDAASGKTGVPSVTVGGKTFKRDLPNGVMADEVQNKYTDPATGQVYYDLTSLTTEGQKRAAAAVGAGGPTPVICTELWRNGKLPLSAVRGSMQIKKLLTADELHAYFKWGCAVVRLMRRNSLVDYFAHRWTLSVLRRAAKYRTRASIAEFIAICAAVAAVSPTSSAAAWETIHATHPDIVLE